MNNIYETLIEYLELKINNLKQDNSKNIVKLYEAIVLFLNTPKNELNKLDSITHEIICIEIFKNDQSLVNKYRFLCAYSGFIDNPFLSQDPQIIDANNNYNIIVERLNNLLKKLEIQIYKIKRKQEESQALISVYESYLSLFNKNGVIRGIDADEMNSFFQFLKNSTLDKKVVLDIIIEFSKFNLSYQINKRRLKTTSRIKEIEIKTEEVTKELAKNVIPTPSVEVSQEKIPETLNDEEQKTLNKIKVIISNLNGILGDSSLLELLDGEFTIDGRKEIYEAAGADKWKLIYDDITQNLLPNFENNKDNIIGIFEYIINIYTGKKQEQQQKQEFKIEYPDIIKLEETRIKNYLELSKKSRFIYVSYDEDKQRLIDIAYSYLQNGDEIGLKSLKLDIPLTDIVFMKNLDKLKSLINDCQMLKELTNEEILSFGIEEYKDSIKETSDSIVSILNKLDKDYEKMQSEVTITQPQETVVKSNDQENYVIFLNDENGVPIVLDTIENMSTNDNLMDAYRSINNMTNVSYFEFMEKYITSTVKPVRDPQMYKVRRGQSRVAFIQVPISSKNRDKIGEELKNNKRFNLVLVVDFGFKHNASKNQSVYDEFNRIYDINLNQIKQIFSLFSSDFNEKSFEEAQKMLLDGMETVKQMEKQALSREKKGV